MPKYDATPQKSFDASPAESPRVPDEFDVKPDQPGGFGEPIIMAGDHDCAAFTRLLQWLDAGGFEVDVEYRGAYQRVYTIEMEDRRCP